MNPRILLIKILVLTTCLPVTAKSHFDGLRLGIQVGFVGTDSKLNLISLSQATLNSSSNISGRGILGGFVIDLGRISNSKFYYGFEASANLVNSQGKMSTQAIYMDLVSQVTKIQLNQAHDLSVKLGYVVINSVLFHAKLGPTFTQWKSNTVSAAPVSGSITSPRLGVVGGIGVDFSIEDNVSLAIAYNYRYCSTFSYALKNIDNSHVRKITITPNASTISIGLNYRYK